MDVLPPGQPTPGCGLPHMQRLGFEERSFDENHMSYDHLSTLLAKRNPNNTKKTLEII